MTTLLKDLQEWYRSQCNECWEHSYGIKIETLDNPGWAVTVDLTDTNLHRRLFEPHAHGMIADNLTGNEDWIVCKIEEKKFKGFGGPAKLEEIIATFLSWAKSSG